MRTQGFRQPAIRNLLLAVLVFCFCRTLWTARHIHVDGQHDFHVYDTASVLVRQHASKDIYDEADNGHDPQLKFISPFTPFAQAARSIGLPEIRLYVYPPILADLLLPLAGLTAHTASLVWMCLNVCMLAVVALLMVRLLRLSWRSGAALALCAGLFSFFSVAVALQYGQVTILLLLLWVAGFYLYQNDRLALSALALALATSIKLTPLIAVVPFLIWRNWRWVSLFCLWTAALLGTVAVLNSPAVLQDYFLHVMPAMSHGIAHPDNRSVTSCLQMVYHAWHGGTMQQLVEMQAIPAPAWLLLWGKLLPAAALLLASTWVYRNAKHVSRDQQLGILSAFALLSVIVSPVSWTHAYVVAFPLLALCWQGALRGRLSRWQVLLLVAVSLDLGGFLVNDLRIVALRRGEVIASMVTLLGPASALLAVALALQIARDRSPSTKLESTPAYL